MVVTSFMRDVDLVVEGDARATQRGARDGENRENG